MVRRKKSYPWVGAYPEGIEWDVEIPVEPLHSILEESARLYPDNICIDYYGKQYTYSEVLSLSDKMAKGLQDEGVVKGVKVGLFLPNCPMFIVAYYAILKIGGVVVNYNPLYTKTELAAQVRNSGTLYMITLDLAQLFEKTSNLLQTTPLEKVVVCDFKSSLPFPKNVLFGLLKKKEVAHVSFGRINIAADMLMDNDGDYQGVEVDPLEDVAVLQYTGGTTGVPKGVVLTHANLYVNTVQTGMWFHGLDDGKEKMMAVLPFFHVFAMTVVMNLSILKGCQIVIHSRLDVEKLLKDVAGKKITLLPGVPTLFTAINNYENVKNYDLSSLKFCIAGGAPLPVEVKKEFEELSKCTLIEGYGLSESSPVVIANPLFGENKVNSIGVPFPGTVVEIRAVDGRRSLVPVGKIGEICIIGPQVMKGYLDNEIATKETIRSGRLHTGDMGYMDKDGYVYVVDRLKEMIISSGFNVYPREVEEQIYKHSCVEEVAVVGVTDDYSGQLVKAVIKLKAGENVSEDEMKEFLKGKLAKYKQPSIVEFVDSLPKTMIGKIDKKELCAG